MENHRTLGNLHRKDDFTLLQMALQKPMESNIAAANSLAVIQTSDKKSNIKELPITTNQYSEYLIVEVHSNR